MGEKKPFKLSSEEMQLAVDSLLVAHGKVVPLDVHSTGDAAANLARRLVFVRSKSGGVVCRFCRKGPGEGRHRCWGAA